MNIIRQFDGVDDFICWHDGASSGPTSDYTIGALVWITEDITTEMVVCSVNLIDPGSTGDDWSTIALGIDNTGEVFLEHDALLAPGTNRVTSDMSSGGVNFANFHSTYGDSWVFIAAGYGSHTANLYVRRPGDDPLWDSSSFLSPSMLAGWGLAAVWAGGDQTWAGAGSRTNIRPFSGAIATVFYNSSTALDTSTFDSMTSDWLDDHDEWDAYLTSRWTLDQANEGASNDLIGSFDQIHVSGTESIPAPFVFTGEASDIDGSSASLGGTLYCETGTSYWLDWGDSPAVENSTEAAVIGGPRSIYIPTDASSILNGLSPVTQYYYRTVAQNSSRGTVEGEIKTFITTSAKPIVSTGSASDLTISSAKLNGTVNPAGESTSYWFEWGETDSYGNTAPLSMDGDAGSGTSAVAVSEVVSGLTPGTTYHFRIVAQNSLGITEGEDNTFTTEPLTMPTGHAYTKRAWRVKYNSTTEAPIEFKADAETVGDIRLAAPQRLKDPIEFGWAAYGNVDEFTVIDDRESAVGNAIEVKPNDSYAGIISVSDYIVPKAQWRTISVWVDGDGTVEPVFETEPDDMVYLGEI
jgi:hypothetical protein